MHDDGYFDQDVAATYDTVHTAGDIGPIVGVLRQLAADGTALEFAIGTGRVALPLSHRGVPVKGIELSKAMIAELRKKDAGSAIDVTVGDMTTTRVAGSFSLVYLVYNTIDNLTSQDAQIACFQNAFAHLAPGGRFLIETLVPPLQRIPFGETKLANDCSPDHWGVDEFDVVTQHYTSHHVRFADGKVDRLSIPFRYCWPAEFDVMAKFAGFKLESRWSDWTKDPFTNLSKRHISVWQKPSE